MVRLLNRFNKLALLTLAILCLPSLAHAQGAFISGTANSVVNGLMRPLAGATVTVCAGSTSGLPCSPALANSLFKDLALTQPLANPTTTDSQGNYNFAMASGTYTVTITASGFTGQSQQVTVSCAVGACTASSATFTTLTVSGAGNLNGGGNFTGTFTGSPTLSGTWLFTGIPALQLSNAGVFTNVSNTFSAQNLVGGLTQTQINNLLAHEFGASFFFTDAWEAGLQVPGTSAVKQANTYNTFLINRSTATNAVGYFSVAVAGANGVHFWPMNNVCQDQDETGTTYTSTQCIGIENDLNANHTTTTLTAYTAAGNWTAQPAANANGYTIGQPGGGFHWWNAFMCQQGATLAPSTTGACLTIQPLASGVNQASQGISFISNDPSAGQNNATLNETAGGDLILGNQKTGAGFLATILKVNEVAAPSGVNGQGVLYEDSTTHWPAFNPNNSAFRKFLLAGSDANNPLETKRFGASCTTAASAQATCTSTFSWTNAFPDASYTPVCWGEGPSGSPILTLSTTQIAASITVQVQNAAAAASSFAGVYCNAIHD